MSTDTTSEKHHHDSFEKHEEAFYDERPTAINDLERVPDAHVSATAGEDLQYGMKMTEDERRLHRRVNLKFDLLILPVMSLLYLMNGLDRSNIGNAQTAGFTKDIGIPATAVNNSTSLFYITFILFQPIGAACGRIVGVKYWLPAMMICWGMFTLAHAYVKSEGELIAYRLMIGVFEASFYPCATYYLSTCYIRFDFAFRVAIFYGCYALAGAFSSIIAYGILHIKGALHDWQYLFIIEGALTAVLGIFALFWLPRHISTAWFLSDEERQWAKVRMERDSGGQDNASRGITRRDIIESLKDWKFWSVLPLNIAASVPSQSFSIFLPIIVQGLGYKGIQANLFSVPIYAIAAVGLWCFAYSSDRFRERGWHIVASLCFCLVGLVMASTIQSPKARYAALCILQIGSYTAPPLTVAWLAGNTPNPGKRSLILGYNGWGNLAGVIGSQLFRPAYAPRYQLPFHVCLGVNLFALVGYTSYRFLLKGANARRKSKIASWSAQEIEDETRDDPNGPRFGDKKYTFRYAL